MRVKCILYTVGYIILGRNERLYFDVKLKYLYLFLGQGEKRFSAEKRTCEFGVYRVLHWSPSSTLL